MNLSKTILVVGVVIVLLVVLGMIAKGTEGFLPGFGTAGAPPVGKFVMYYADWCPHCKSVKPAFQSWMSTQTVVTAQMYEADKDAAKVQAAGVKGFPTFVLKKADGTTVECNARDADGWNAFLKSNL